MDVAISSAEAARLICGEDVMLEADQPLLPAPSETAPEPVDSGVSTPVFVVTPGHPWDHMPHTKVTLGS